MTLKLEMLASLDATGIAAGAALGRREVASLGKTATANAKQTEAAYRAQKREADKAAAAAAKAARAAQNGGRQAATATKLAAHEATNLSFQMNDIAVGLASGQSPFTVMMQQGTQISQIMGPRGLGQIIPALGAGLMSLVNPTTLVLAGLTAVGYAASSVFGGMQDDVAETDRALERHEQLIKDIRQAYDAARDGAVSYGIKSMEVLELERRIKARDDERRLFSQAQDLLDERAFQPGRIEGLGTSTAAYAGITAALEKFRASVQAGTPDVVTLRKELAAVVVLAGTENQKGVIQDLIDASDDLFLTNERLRQLRKSLEEINQEAQQASLNKYFDRQGDRLNRLGGERNALRHSLTRGDTQDEADALRTRYLATIEAGIEITRRGLDMHSEEADRIRETTAAIAEATIARDRQKEALDRVINARDFLKTQDEEIARIRLETTLIGQSNAERTRQIALLEAEQEIRRRKLDGDSEQAVAIRQAALAKAAARAAQESASALHGLNQAHDEQMQRLRLEQTLLGQSNDVRSAALTLLRAEQDIRRRGIDTNSELAQSIRANARALADETAELSKQKKAWNEVEKAGTGAIDRLVDGIASGKPGDALTGILQDLNKSFLQLSLGNPLKNALYGAGLPTLSDTGGIGGFFRSLFGGGAQAMTAANMNVNAATVLLTGSGLSPFGAPGAAAGSARALASGVVGPLGGGTVAEQAWRFFSGKGLADFQVAGILGNMKAESAFNPLAVGDGGNAFGLFQHNDRRHNLFNFLGGRSNLGNVQGQLEFAWKELMTTESRAFRNLMNSTDLRGATAAFGGFERPAGFSYANPEAMHNWTGRLKFAEEALNQFGGKLGTSAQSLTSFEGGVGRAATSLANGSGNLADTASDFAGQSQELAGSLSKGVQNLVNSFPAAPLGGGNGGGGLAGWVGRLLSGFGGIGGGSQLASVASGAIGLFDKGRFTGTGRDDELAGFTHRNEFVFSAPAVRAIGVKNLDALHSGALRGFREGGFVTSNPMPLPQPANGNATAPAAMNTLTIRLIREDGSEIATTQAPTQGGKQVDVMIDDIVAQKIGNKGSKIHKQLEGVFGARMQLRKS